MSYCFQQLRPKLLLNVESKIFFTVSWQGVNQNGLIFDTSVKKAGCQDSLIACSLRYDLEHHSGCRVEKTAMRVTWLDQANAYD